MTFYLNFVLSLFLLFSFDVKANCVSEALSLIKHSVQLRSKVFGLHYTLAKSKNIQVFGSRYHALKLGPYGRGVLQRVERFDKELVNMGLTLPKHTTIYVNKGAIFDFGNGARYISDRSFNIWNGKINDIIELNEWGKEGSRILNSKSILDHERMHAILYSTYNKESFVVKTSVIQETFADFTTSFLHNRPDHAYNFYGNNYALRNIKEKKFSEFHKGMTSVRDMKSIYDFNHSYHQNSILFSNVLWDIYEKIGKDKMKKILKPILDDLNDHYDSYVTLTKIQKELYLSERDSDLFNYFLNSINKTIKKFPEIEKDVSKIIEAKVIENRVDVKAYKTIKNALEPSGKDYTQQSSRIREAVKLALIALPSEVGMIYVTYTAYDKIKKLFVTDKK